MALSKSITKNLYGKDVIYENCYLKIDNYFGDKINFTFSLIYYDESKTYILDSKQFSIVPNLDGQNFIKQGYEYLKSLNEFKNAINLLDEEEVI